MNQDKKKDWLHVSVLEVRSGAAYNDIVFDQDLIARTVDNKVLTIFDINKAQAQDHGLL